MATTFRLIGLEPDNLLAFLALVGTLRALEEARPDWRVRSLWSGPPWHPELDVDADVDDDALLAAIAEGVERLGSVVDFGKHKNIDFTRAEFGQFGSAASDHVMSRMMSAIGSDACARRDGDRIESTALAAIAGQGHQNFLERVAVLGRRSLRQDTGVLRKALLAAWSYEELENTLRWDPVEDRRYALGFADPSGEKIKTSAGANVLAVVGFPMLVTAPGPDGLMTTAFARRRRAREMRWPLWTRPCGLATIVALLRHPALVADIDRNRADEQRAEWTRRGVADIKRARRIQTGKYFSFERAVSIWTAT